MTHVTAQAAIMAVGDLCRVFGTDLLPLLDAGGAAQPQRSLLAQLLQKAASNDKRFVIDEVSRALATMAEVVAPRQMLDRLLPYAAHKNPKVRPLHVPPVEESSHLHATSAMLGMYRIV
jgi:hypothetical protein